MSVELSLDEIAAQLRRKNRGGGGGRGRGGGGGRRRGGGGGGGGLRRSGGGGGGISNGNYFTRAVPTGRWKHDKFNEIYGGGGGGGSSSAPRRRSAGSGGGGGRGVSARFARPISAATGGKPNDIVKLNISNLAETVVTADLEELFEAYKILGVTVHYDEAGNHLGTADVFLTRRTAEQIINDFSGVAIDGREMKIFVVDESNASGAAAPLRARISDRLERTRSNPIRNRVARRRSGGGGGGGGPRSGRRGIGGGRGGGGGGSARPPKREKAPVLSQEELDRELESYMGGTSGRHKRISID